MDIEKIAKECGADKTCRLLINNVGDLHKYEFTIEQLQTYTNEIIEMCAKEAEISGLINCAHNLRNLKSVDTQMTNQMDKDIEALAIKIRSIHNKAQSHPEYTGGTNELGETTIDEINILAVECLNLLAKDKP